MVRHVESLQTPPATRMFSMVPSAISTSALPRCPIPEDSAFAERLARDKVVVLPGRAVELPGYLRLSLTATEDMIERALPVFGAAIKELRAAA
jgi:hypothetical protein